MGDTIARLRTLQGMLEFVWALIPAWVDEDPGHPANALVERLISVSDRVHLAAEEIYYVLADLQRSVAELALDAETQCAD